MRYLNNQNLLANTVEHRISEGVYEGMQYMPFTPGFLKAGQTGLSLIQKGAVGTKEALNTMGQWAAQHPKTTEAIVAGTVSTGFDIYNGNVTPEGIAMNYAVAGAMAGRSLGKQLAIATSYKALTSGVNDHAKMSQADAVRSSKSDPLRLLINSLLFKQGITWYALYGNYLKNSPSLS